MMQTVLQHTTPPTNQRIINMPAKTGTKGFGKGRAKLGSKKRKARRKKS